MACQTTINPNYSTNTVLHKPPPIATKQSTLDKFIAIPTPKPPLPHDSNNRNSVVVEQGDASCIKIDPEAAKTWIYPGPSFFFLCLGLYKRVLIMMLMLLSFYIFPFHCLFPQFLIFKLLLRCYESELYADLMLTL